MCICKFNVELPNNKNTYNLQVLLILLLLTFKWCKIVKDCFFIYYIKCVPK